MRGLVMTPRSVYHGQSCPHCGRRIQMGRAFVGTTLYVDPSNAAWVKTQRTPHVGIGIYVGGTQSHVETRADRELEIRVAYHRKCLEKVLAKSPLDPEESAEALNDYREKLLERYVGGGSQ